MPRRSTRNPPSNPQANPETPGKKRALDTADDSATRRSKRSRTNNTEEQNPLDKTNGATTVSASVEVEDTGIVSVEKKTERVKRGNAKGSKRTREGDVKTETEVNGGDTAEQAEEGAVEGDGEADEVTVTKKTRTRKKKTKAEIAAEMPPLAARTQGLSMYIGAHVSAAKGVHNSITNSVHVGGNAFALFLKSQRKWDNPPLQDDHRDQFRKNCTDHNYDARYILPHGSYLVNLAQEDPAKAKQAYTSFLDDLQRCEELGIQLYNFHPGATNQTTLESSLSRLAKQLMRALDATKTVTPVLETMCGHGTTIGGKLSDFSTLLSLIPQSYHSRLGICIDTCHVFSAGYDLRTPETWNAFMAEFDKQIGLKYLRAMHINDSKAPFASKRDLHANIGTGFLGLRSFYNIMNDPRLEGIPMILETPIDRPVQQQQQQNGQEAQNGNGNEESGSSSGEEEESDSEPKTKRKKQTKAKTTKKSTKPAMVEDKSVWAREIKLLESLIGMDVESEEFRTLEAQLAEEGRQEREKQQESYDRKLEKLEKDKEKAQKKAEKAKEKNGQRNLKDMFGKNANGTVKEEE